MSKHDITALIYDKRGNLLSMGRNSYVKTHPLQAKYAKDVGEDYKVFVHAEIHAIARCRDLNKAHKIVIMRYGKSGQPLLAKPCRICEHAISFTNIKEIVHT